jgi:hypothetical protein
MALARHRGSFSITKVIVCSVINAPHAGMNPVGTNSVGTTAQSLRWLPIAIGVGKRWPGHLASMVQVHTEVWLHAGTPVPGKDRLAGEDGGRPCTGVAGVIPSASAAGARLGMT